MNIFLTSGKYMRTFGSEFYHHYKQKKTKLIVKLKKEAK